MALDSAETSILEEGVFFLEDPNIGKGVDEFEGKGFPFRTEEGIDFWSTNILEHEASNAQRFKDLLPNSY